MSAFDPIADIRASAHHSPRMSHERYNRFVVRSTNISLWMVAIVAGALWVATLADHILSLGWGFDIQGLWLAPLIATGALLVRAISLAIFRVFGALD